MELQFDGQKSGTVTKSDVQREKAQKVQKKIIKNDVNTATKAIKGGKIIQGGKKPN